MDNTQDEVAEIKDQSVLSKNGKNKHIESVIEIDPPEACLWKFKDRQPFELGDLNEFAQELKIQGQTVPIIIRPAKDNPPYCYEIISGERRWRAAKIAQIKLKAILRTLTEQEAFITQASENQNRKAISDYSIGLAYQKLVDSKVITVKNIQEKLGLEKSAVSNLLSFGKVPPQIWKAVGNVSNVSARTATEIRTLANKGEHYIAALISIAPEIREGQGARRIQKLVNDLLAKHQALALAEAPEKIVSKDGKHLFTWGNHGHNVIVFSEHIMNGVNVEQLIEIIKTEVEKLLDSKS